MPNLPTVTVTDAQAARITAAYGDATAYKAWLKQAIKDYVFRKEAEAITAKAQTDVQTKLAQVESDLGTMT